MLNLRALLVQMERNLQRILQRRFINGALMELKVLRITGSSNNSNSVVKINWLMHTEMISEKGIKVLGTITSGRFKRIWKRRNLPYMMTRFVESVKIPNLMACITKH